MEDRKALIVGISGCSSSGKTTLARLLRDIFPNTFIIHEDDFYKPETELPMKDGLLDWDCAESISIPDMEKALLHIHSEGTFPPGLDSKEDRNSVGECPASAAKIAALKARVAAWLQPGRPGQTLLAAPGLRLCVLDGFLLYCDEMRAATALLDVRLFVRASRAAAARRRAARDGYVTLEGFWTDPPGYVDKVVWPNYVAAHAWMFEGGNVEGRLDEDALVRQDIKAQVGKGPDVDFEETLEWAVDTLMAELERLYPKHEG